MPEERLTIDVIATTSNAEAGFKRVGTTAESELGAGGKLGKAGKEGESALGKMGKGAGGLLSSFTGLSLGQGAIALGFGALAIAGHSVIDAWQKNEEALTTLKTAMKDAGEKDTPKFEAALRKAQLAGEDLGFSQADTTGTMAKLTLAGVNQADALKQLPVIMDLARAKGISLADATAIYTKGIAGAAKGLKDLNIVGLQALPTTAAISAAHVKLAQDIAKYGANSVQAKAEQEKLNTTLNTAAVRAHNLAAMHDELDKKVGGQAKAHAHELGVEWASVTSKFNDFAGQAIPFVLKGVTFLLGVLTNVIGWVSGTLIPIFVSVGKIVGPIFGVIVGIWVTEIKIVIAVISTAVGVIINVIKTIVGPVRVVVGTIGTIVGGITGFFKTVFGGIGATIGGFAGAIANAVKAVVNPIITIINLFISGIDILITGVNKVVGAIPFVGSHLQIGLLPQISQMAAGGVVKATPGGILALLGEGGHDEAVTPLPTGWQSGSASRPSGGTTVNVSVASNADPQQISRAVVWGLRARARVA